MNQFPKDFYFNLKKYTRDEQLQKLKDCLDHRLNAFVDYANTSFDPDDNLKELFLDDINLYSSILANINNVMREDHLKVINDLKHKIEALEEELEESSLCHHQTIQLTDPLWKKVDELEKELKEKTNCLIRYGKLK